MTGKVTLYVQVDPELKVALEDLAHRDRTDVSKLVRKILTEWIDTETSKELTSPPFEKGGF